MLSLFPGMDPYLEGYLWPDVHQALAYQYRRQLAPLVAPKYAVRLAVTMITDRVPAHRKPRRVLPCLQWEGEGAGALAQTAR